MGLIGDCFLSVVGHDVLQHFFVAEWLAALVALEPHPWHPLVLVVGDVNIVSALSRDGRRALRFLFALWRLEVGVLEHHLLLAHFFFLLVVVAVAQFYKLPGGLFGGWGWRALLGFLF